MSEATQRKGTKRLSKFQPALAVAGANRLMNAWFIWIGLIRLVGRKLVRICIESEMSIEKWVNSGVG